MLVVSQTTVNLLLSRRLECYIIITNILISAKKYMNHTRKSTLFGFPPKFMAYAKRNWCYWIILGLLWARILHICIRNVCSSKWFYALVVCILCIWFHLYNIAEGMSKTTSALRKYIMGSCFLVAAKLQLPTKIVFMYQGINIWLLLLLLHFFIFYFSYSKRFLDVSVFKYDQEKTMWKLMSVIKSSDTSTVNVDI